MMNKKSFRNNPKIKHQKTVKKCLKKVKLYIQIFILDKLLKYKLILL